MVHSFIHRTNCGSFHLTAFNSLRQLEFVGDHFCRHVSPLLSNLVIISLIYASTHRQPTQSPPEISQKSLEKLFPTWVGSAAPPQEIQWVGGLSKVGGCPAQRGHQLPGGEGVPHACVHTTLCWTVVVWTPSKEATLASVRTKHRGQPCPGRPADHRVTVASAGGDRARGREDDGRNGLRGGSPNSSKTQASRSQPYPPQGPVELVGSRQQLLTSPKGWQSTKPSEVWPL